jgi:molybdopterin-guanine dinucleotide biosynthesis protein B
MTVPILSIVGRSNSGKTTLLEKLIAALAHRGLRVGTIKHSHHQPEMDTPGKDSWRHKQAGAAASLLVGPERMLMVQDVEEDLNPRLLAERYFADFDLLLVEGYASLPGDKIEVMRAARSTQLRCQLEELLAVVTDIPSVHPDLPQFELNDIEALSEFILHWMGHAS